MRADHLGCQFGRNGPPASLSSVVKTTISFRNGTKTDKPVLGDDGKKESAGAKRSGRVAKVR